MFLYLKKLFKDHQLYNYLLIVLLFFGNFIKTHFSVDTYQLAATNNMSYMNIYKEDGRLIQFFIIKIFSLLNLNITAIHIILFFISIFCMTFSISILYKTINKYLNNSLLAGLLSIMILINPFSIELWLFTEMAVMELSILCYIIAVKYFDLFLCNKNKKYLLFTILVLLIGIFSYQGTIAIFVALSAILVFYNSERFIEFFKNNLWLIICYFIPSFLNLICAKIMGTSRLEFNFDLIEKIMFFTNPAINVLFNAFWILPAGIFAFYIIITILNSILTIIMSKPNKFSKLKIAAGLFYIIIVTYFFTVLPLFLQNIDEISLFPRSTYAFGSIVGLLLTFIFIFYNNSSNKHKAIIILCSTILLIIQFTQFHKIATNRYLVNQLDKEFALNVKEIFLDYEKNNNKEIKKVALYNLEKSPKFYNEVDDSLNVSAKTEKNSCYYLLRYYLNKDIELIEPNSTVYNIYFKNKKWDSFSLDQVIIIDDILNIYIY